MAEVVKTSKIVKKKKIFKKKMPANVDYSLILQ